MKNLERKKNYKEVRRGRTREGIRMIGLRRERKKARKGDE